MSDYDDGYRAGMQRMREVGQRRIEELSNCVAVLEAKLTKAAEKAYEKCYAKGQYALAQACKDSILAELKGQDDE